MTKKCKSDRRDIPVTNELLEHIANCPDGGSGEGSYISGRIQSMAREILKYRKQDFDIESLDPDERSWYYDGNGTKRKKDE